MERKKRKKPYPLLAGRAFSRVSDLEAEIRGILKNYVPLNAPVQGENGDLLTAYMKTHESLSYQEERSGPLKHVEIRFNPAVTAAKPEDRRQIWLIFENGDEEPFSYRAARSNWGVEAAEDTRFKLHRTWIRRAGRCLIKKELDEFRQVVLEGEGLCELSGEQLSAANADIHHEGLSFEWLLFNFFKEYCAEHKSCLIDVTVVDTNSYGTKCFESEQVNQGWIEYHAKNARLICVTKDQHYKLHKNMPKPPWSELY